MRWIPQCLLVLLLCSAFSVQGADKDPKASNFEALEIRRSLFPTDKVKLADSVRDDFADNCAILAANKIAIEGRNTKTLKQARHLLALALQLNPRNKRALVTNFRLARGLPPAKSKADYSLEVFAGLLHSVGKDLLKAGGRENIELAGALLSLAVDMNPDDEDIIYAHSLYEIDFGKFDWSTLEHQAPLEKRNTASKIPPSNPNPEP